MAQDITLLGASYQAVPAVTLPKTGGGTASFTDVTDTTAAAADVATGKYFYTAAGVRTEGTSSGGGGGGGYDFFNKSYPQGDLETTTTVLSEQVARGRTGIVSVTSSTTTQVHTAAFYGCTNLESISFPEIIGFGGNAEGSIYHTEMFRNCSKLNSVYAPKAAWVQGQCFHSCTSLTVIALPACKTIRNQCFYGCNHLEAADFGGTTFQMTDQNIFTNCSAFQTLVIRATSVASLSNVNCFNNTPFASSGSGGTIYVPNSLISTYQSATNWSTILGYANNSIQKIEGSYYETHYADGTAIS